MSYLTKENIADIYPLSPMQQGMLFHTLYDPDSATYFEQFCCVIEGPVDYQCLENAWNYLIEQYPVFRTVFNWKDASKPIQVVLKKRPITLSIHDFKGIEAQSQLVHIEEFLHQDTKNRFDLAKGPLLRLNILELAENKIYFVWSYHHIILDGWCLGLILADFFNVYNALKSTQTPPRIQRPKYKNYIAWLDKQDQEKTKQFWTEYLKELESPTPLPWDHKRGTGEFAVKKMNILFTKNETGILEQFARTRRVTMSSLVQAAWGILLGRYNDIDDVVFGATVSGRPANLPGSDQMIGLFINTLPMRINLDTTVGELLANVQKSSSQIQDLGYSFLPDVKACTSLTPAENLFDSIVVFENYPIDPSMLTSKDGFRVSGIKAVELTNFDFCLVTAPGEEMEIALSYARDRFEDDTINRLLQHLKIILLGMVDNTFLPVKDLEILALEEKQKLLYEFNSTEFEYPQDACIHELFEQLVDLSPDNVAVIAGENRFSYAELEKRSNKVAQYLRIHGVGPDSPVGIFMDRCVEMIIGVLGIIKAGGMYVPLDTQYPKARIEYMLSDSGASFILAQSELLENLPIFEGNVLCLDKDWDIVECMPAARPELINKSSDLVYIIYTSGSTGLPKGIEIEHRGLVNYITWAIDYYDVKEQGNFPLYTSMSFDLTVTSIFVPLVAGKSIVLQPPGLDPTTLVEKVITGKDCDIAKLTPAHLEIADRLTDGGLIKPQRLNRFIVGGEALPVRVSRSMLEKYPELTFYNEYGPAETVVGCIVYKFNSLGPECSNVPIGKPIANTKIYILNQNLGLAPIGVSGEICITSPGVARGYLNKEDMTVRHFIQSPFNEGERLYRSGDLGRWLPDGTIEYLGSIDHQIKIRGYRIELGEIEATLGSHDDIQECVVVDHDDSTEDKCILGYYVTGRNISEDDLKVFLRERLPEYMVPVHFMKLDQIPLTVNGKVDRDQLPQLDNLRAVCKTEYVEPRNETEKIIAEIWQKVLGIETIGVFDSFFELGGHSLKATQAIFRMRKDLGIEVPLRAIFDFPTIDGITRAISFQHGQKLKDIEALEQKEYYELSHAQKRLWFLDKLIPNSTSYNIHGDVLIEGDLDLDAVKIAMQTVVNRHESLRTTFSTRDDHPVQIIAEQVDVDIPVVELSDTADDDAYIDQLMDKEAATPFNLETCPLFRMKILKLSGGKYLLMLTMHHIISDGWSLEVLIRDMASAYSVVINDGAAKLPQLKIQYKDYAAWQTLQLEDGSLDKQKIYWCEKLKSPLPVLNLPTDYQRPPVQTTHGDTFRFSLDNELSLHIQKLAKEQDVTLFMMLLAAFGVFLNKLSQQEDIIIGTPIAGRNHPDLEGLIGFFVNTLAIRMDLSNNPSFLELLDQIKQICLEAYANQDYPFNKLIDVVNPPRDTSRPPIFNVLFVLQNMNEQPNSYGYGDISFKDVTRDMEISKFDLSLYASETTENIGMHLEYNTDLFNAESIERYAENLLKLLECLADAPERPVLDHQVLSEKDRDILERFNATEVAYPLHKSVSQIFEEQAAQMPDRIAVTYEGQLLSYGELDKKTNQLARFLRNLGIGSESMVALMLDRSLEMEIALLGVLKAGGAYIPIGTAYPEARIEYILDDTKAPVVLTQQRFAYKFLERNIHVFCLDSMWDEIKDLDSTHLDAINGPENLAYILYTSGSTGTPKGVACLHKGLTNRIIWMQDAYGLNQEDVVLQKTPYTFDVSGWEFYWALMYGAHLHFLKPGGEKDPRHIMEAIRDNKITTLHFVPSMLGGFLQVVDDDNRQDLQSLRRVICSGEALLAEHRRLFFKYLDCELHNLYGPTEASIDVTYYECRATQTSATIPIGRPVANTKIFILDKYMNLLPIGVPGEIYLSGVQLARGYVNKPEKTAEAFIQHPISPDGRLYKTGDLGKWLPDGNIEYLGRIDHQVKIRGNRIELGEVEAVLSRFEGVHDCVVVDKEEPVGGKFLVGYYVSNEEIPVGGLREFLDSALPDYMVPSRFVYMEALPLNSSGKVDRNALPEVENIRPEMVSEYVAPRNELEEKLALIWQEVLGIDRAGVKDNFFDLGGHSLKATQVLARIKREIGPEIPLRLIFEDPTIEGLCHAIETDAGTKLPEIEPLPKQKSYALSHAQKRLWFLDQMIPDSPAYNMPIPFIIKGPFYPEAICRALQNVVDRHETLRTTFRGEDNGPVQIVNESFLVNVEIESAAELSDVDLKRIVTEESLKPFNLVTGPLFRTRILEISPQKHLFIMVMHHIISDGWSLEIMVKELIASYLAYVENRQPQLPLFRIQYKDYALWQNNLLEDGSLQDQEEFWLSSLGGELPVLDLPADRPRPAIQTTNGAVYRIEIGSELAGKLRDLAKKQDVTTFMLLLGVLDLFMYRMSGIEDIIIGTPIAGRNHPDLEGLIGFFVNTLALRTDLSGNPSFTEVLRRVKQTCIGAYANQDYPFDKLIDKLNIARDTSRTPIFSIMFAMQDVAEIKKLISRGDLSLESLPGEQETTKLDMTIFAVDSQDQLEFCFEYNTDLFNPQTVHMFAEYYINLLDAVSRDCEKMIADYDMLGEKKWHQVVVEFNATKREYPRDATLLELFEKQVDSNPDRPAVVFQDTGLSYFELNERANMLANYLRSCGVNQGSVVGMIVGSPMENIVGLVAILKSGGAYMPIDPEWPEGRISYMLDDSKAPVVLTPEQHVHKLPVGITIVCIDRDWAEISTFNAENPESVNIATDIAYAIYTSGSTGRPKGSLIPHRGVVNLVHALYDEVYSFYEMPLKVAQVASFCFDASVQQIFASLLLGHTLYPIPGSMKRDMEELIPYLLNNEIEIIDGTPSLWEVMVEHGIANEQRLMLKHIIIGGEALPVSLIKRFAGGRNGQSVRWTNVYGVTESSVDSTAYLVDLDAVKDMNFVPIGRPVANTCIYILDKDMNPLPVGVPGELYIAGDGLALGYLNNEERTRENFIPDPFDLGGKLYKTADLAKWLPDGNIEFLGRVDFQVKIRGFRIELGEVESVLSSHQDVSDCVVVDKDDAGGGKFLVAYYVAEEEIPISELRSFLGQQVPDYMIPLRFMRLDALPLNTSGKVDRNSLPEIEALRPEMQIEYIAPRNEIEEILALVWKEVLGIDKVGVNDNFFELGGDSIISLQVVNRLKKHGYEIRPRHMFEHQTIAEITPVVEIISEVKAEQGPVIGDAPLTPIQHWFKDLNLANKNHFNQSVIFRSAVKIEEEFLKKSLQAIVDHHDVLRSRLRNGRQNFMPLDEEVLLVVKDVQHEDDLTVEANNLQAVLDIGSGPLFAAGLFHGPREDYLMLVAHHLVVDGVSWRILLEDLFKAYGAVANGSDIDLPEKTSSFKDWAVALEAYAQREDLLLEADYWKNDLDAAIPEIPVDHDLGPNDVASQESLCVELDREETDKVLRDAHRAYGTDTNDLLLTALMRALIGWKGLRQVVIDVEGHGREDVLGDVNVSRTVGWFTTIYPVVFKPEADNLKSHITYVKEKLREIPNKGFNYCILKYLAHCDLPINTGISFNYLGQTSISDANGIFQMVDLARPGTVDGSNCRANYVDIICMAVDGRLRIDAMYSRNKFSQETIQGLIYCFKKELIDVIAHCMDPEHFDVTPSDFALTGFDQAELDSIYK